MDDRRRAINELLFQLNSKEVKEHHDPIQLSVTDAEKILALLKEQEAVEPNPVHNSLRWFACGKCDCSITREDRFCPRCGHEVKWEWKS